MLSHAWRKPEIRNKLRPGRARLHRRQLLIVSIYSIYPDVSVCVCARVHMCMGIIVYYNENPEYYSNSQLASQCAMSTRADLNDWGKEWGERD